MSELDYLEERISDIETRLYVLEDKDPRNHNRYPYTYAADHARKYFGVDSRSEASKMIKNLAKQAKITEREMFVYFAEAYINDSQ